MNNQLGIFWNMEKKLSGLSNHELTEVKSGKHVLIVFVQYINAVYMYNNAEDF